MTVRRIISNIATGDITAAKRFYQHELRLEVSIDHGWIAT
jgi:hypothetical protein